MNNLLARAHESPFSAPTSQPLAPSYSTLTKAISTLALLLLGYLALTFFDTWPSTFKRSVYELILHIIPSRLIYAMQYGLVRLGYLSREDARFKPSNFEDKDAKQEAMRRIFGQSQLPLALRKVRTLSGPLMSLSGETGPPGLGNWDNSCYQNSVLQGFASLPAFFQYVEQSEAFCERYDTHPATHHALVGFLKQLANSNSRTTLLWTPKVLKSMDSWQQQDAQEYLSRVLEAIEKEAAQYARRLQRSSVAGLECCEMAEKLNLSTKLHEPSTASQQPDTDSKRSFSAPIPLQPELRNPIEGMTAQHLQCKTCGFTEGLSLTQFTCLTLNLGLQGESDIAALLEEYTTPEDIEGVECDSCTMVAQAGLESSTGSCVNEDESQKLTKHNKKAVLRTKAKQVTLGRLPKDLLLHINRSIYDNYGNQLKNTAPVRFPAKLEVLSRWCAPLNDDQDTIEAVYELKCAVTHYGSHHDGHYIALGKRDKHWYSFNDERVIKITEEEVLARGNVFMLFYEAIDVSPSSTIQTRTSSPVDEISAFSDAVLDFEDARAELPAAGQALDPEALSELDEAESQVSDEEMLDSQSELDPTGEFSRDTTPASSENGSPKQAHSDEHESKTGLVFPVMKTAAAVEGCVENGHAKGVPIVSVP